MYKRTLATGNYEPPSAQVVENMINQR